MLDVLFNVILPFRMPVSEQQINKNIELLKQTDWFSALLHDDTYRQYIIHDREVRKYIGKFRTKTLGRHPNHPKFKRRVIRILRKMNIVQQ